DLCLRVSDSLGLFGTTCTRLVVSDGQPVAVLGVTPNPAACNEQLHLDGSLSVHTFPGRVLVAHEWDLDYDGDTFDVDANGPVVTTSYSSFGDRVVALRVRGSGGEADVDLTTELVRVRNGNSPPVADPGGPYVLIVGESLALDSSGSVDADAACGDFITFAW